ncbi:hypothetical protein HGA11_09790 [Mycolicibacterium septicum DSM 44393]|uniref:Uncharacterized protein n=1 Tax=Mycolicibacterium septicum DSM 44393 TaxID=1341646 RepID=A0A7X6MM12_9MYCO|nr:hypothetical protein [Mycolicibacterium septicum]NKZ11267.1 hypothetical protein [Mycolicibacterium septicum DSM 44393]
MDLGVVGIDSGQPVGQRAVVDLAAFVGEPADLDVQGLQGVWNACAQAERAVTLAEFDDARFACPGVDSLPGLALLVRPSML